MEDDEMVHLIILQGKLYIYNDVRELKFLKFKKLLNLMLNREQRGVYFSSYLYCQLDGKK